MTVQQLLCWVSFAHDRHDCSFDEVTGKHTLCLKQALLDSEPKIETHGYGTSEGERELAIVLIHTCNYNEVSDMEHQAYNISKQPMGIPTNVEYATPAAEPFPCYITATEAIQLAEAGRISVPEPPSVDWGSNPQTSPAAPYLESPLRALSIEESRGCSTELSMEFRQPSPIVINTSV